MATDPIPFEMRDLWPAFETAAQEGEQLARETAARDGDDGREEEDHHAAEAFEEAGLSSR